MNFTKFSIASFWSFFIIFIRIISIPRRYSYPTDRQAAVADIDSLQSQLAFGVQRRDDIIRLADRGASSEFQLQEAISTIEQLEAGLRAALARKAGLERRIAA